MVAALQNPSTSGAKAKPPIAASIRQSLARLPRIAAAAPEHLNVITNDVLHEQEFSITGVCYNCFWEYGQMLLVAVISSALPVEGSC